MCGARKGTTQKINILVAANAATKSNVQTFLSNLIQCFGGRF
jgi:hypothetical protein